MQRLLLILGFLLWGLLLQAQEASYQLLENLAYYSTSEMSADSYLSERCKLDLYYPENSQGFASIVWFHGGGLERGNKHIDDYLKNKGIAVIAVNYRFSPKVSCPAYIEDAAAAVAWVFKNIKKYGGDPKLIFLSGHSAGGYLASMLGMDKSYLAVHNIDADSLAGLIPFSGHTITHFTVRSERGIKGTQPLIDKYAPLFHVRKEAPPLILITGDREKELLGRYEENAYMMRMMKVVGHTKTILYELDGYGHNMVHPAYPLLVKHVREITKEIMIEE